MTSEMIFGPVFVAFRVRIAVQTFRNRVRRAALRKGCVRVIGKVIRVEDWTSGGDITSAMVPMV